MKVVDFEGVSSADWDELVEKSPDGWLYQTTRYLTYTAALGKKSLSFGVVTDSNELLAVVPCYLEERSLEDDRDNNSSPLGDRRTRFEFLLKVHRKMRSFAARVGRKVSRLLALVGLRPSGAKVAPCFQLNLGYSGYAISSKVGDKGRKKILRLIYSHLDEMAEKNGVEELVVRKINPLDGDPLRRHSFNLDWFFGVSARFQSVPRVTVILDLRKTEEELWKGLDEDNRNIVRQAEKKGVAFRAGSAREDLKEFHDIHVESWDRTMNHHQSLEMYQTMVDTLGTQSVRILFADHGGGSVSAVLLHVYNNGVFYWGGCSRLGALKLGANNYLLWHSILWAKQQGWFFFEVGMFDSHRFGNGKEYSVGQYKKQFSSRFFMEFEARKYYSERPLLSDQRLYLREFEHYRASLSKASKSED